LRRRRQLSRGSVMVATRQKGRKDPQGNHYADCGDRDPHADLRPLSVPFGLATIGGATFQDCRGLKRHLGAKREEDAIFSWLSQVLNHLISPGRMVEPPFWPHFAMAPQSVILGSWLLETDLLNYTTLILIQGPHDSRAESFFRPRDFGEEMTPNAALLWDGLGLAHASILRPRPEEATPAEPAG